MAELWLVSRDGEQYGPADRATVASWIADGRITVDDPVWTAGMNQWLPIRAIAAFSHVPVPVIRMPPVAREPGAPRWGTAPVATAAARPSLGMRVTLPVGRSGWAIAAGYLGLVGCLFWPVGIVAALVGIVGLTRIDRAPHLLGRGRCLFAIVSPAVGFVLLVLILTARRT